MYGFVLLLLLLWLLLFLQIVIFKIGEENEKSHHFTKTNYFTVISGTPGAGKFVFYGMFFTVCFCKLGLKKHKIKGKIPKKW